MNHESYCNQKPQEFPPGIKLADVVKMIREVNKDDPVTKSLLEKTGKDHIIFLYNRRVILGSDQGNYLILEDNNEKNMLIFALEPQFYCRKYGFKGK